MERVLPDLAWSSYLRALRLTRRSDTTVRDYAYTYRALTEWLGRPAVEATWLEIEAWPEERLPACGGISTTRAPSANGRTAKRLSMPIPLERIPRRLNSDALIRQH